MIHISWGRWQWCARESCWVCLSRQIGLIKVLLLLEDWYNVCIGPGWSVMVHWNEGGMIIVSEELTAIPWGPWSIRVFAGVFRRENKTTYDRWTLLRSLKPKVYWNIAGLVRLRKETVETRLFNWTYLNTLHFVLQYFGLKAVVIWSREII